VRRPLLAGLNEENVEDFLFFRSRASRQLRARGWRSRPEKILLPVFDTAIDLFADLGIEQLIVAEPLDSPGDDFQLAQFDGQFAVEE
jgi:hypothetical protein